MNENRIFALVLGVAAVLSQLLFAPLIAISGAFPCFPLIACVVLVVLQPQQSHYGLAFAMGLAVDLLGHGVPGASSLVLLSIAFALPFAVDTIGNDHLLMVLGLLFAGIFAADLVMGIISAGAAGVAFPAAFVHVILPGAALDLALAFLGYLLLSRLGAGEQRGRAGSSVSNIRFR